MKTRYIPAALIIIGLISIQLGLFSPLREIAIVPWSAGLLLLISAVAVASIRYRRRTTTEREKTAPTRS